MTDWSNPTVSSQLLFSTVRIETVDAAENPLAVGTSFVLAHTFPKRQSDLFLVSNKHVVEGAETGFIYFTSRGADRSPVIGKPFFVRLDNFELQWHGHPDPRVDVAVFPLSWELDVIKKAGVEPYLMELSSTMMISESEIERAEPFQPVLFVGYPNGLFDEVNYTPIFRQGTLATPLQFDFSGTPSFLIDASVFPGSSGSPVYSYSLSIKGSIIDVRLLGILSSVFTQSDEGKIVPVPAPTSTDAIVSFDQILDLGVVIKSSKILETLKDFGRKHGLIGAA